MTIVLFWNYFSSIIWAWWLEGTPSNNFHGVIYWINCIFMNLSYVDNTKQVRNLSIRALLIKYPDDMIWNCRTQTHMHHLTYIFYLTHLHGDGTRGLILSDGITWWITSTLRPFDSCQISGGTCPRHHWRQHEQHHTARSQIFRHNCRINRPYSGHHC